MNFKHIALVAALTLAPAALLAQTPTPGRNDYNVNQRRANQQGRIAQGDRSGQLTPGETGRLENEQHGLHQEEKGMRAQDNGHLTHQDRTTLHHQQNQQSRRIYRAKHNGRVN